MVDITSEVIWTNYERFIYISCNAYTSMSLYSVKK